VLSLAKSAGWRNYALAVATVAVALLITYTLRPLRVQPPTLLFFAAVILTSWYAGKRAALVASILSMVALDVFFVATTLSPQFEVVEDGVDLLAFATAGWLVNAFQQQWRHAQRRLLAVEQEMQIAHRIQQQFFPAAAPNVPGFDIAGSCLPATDVGGDFFDFVSLPNGCLGIALGDVSGHGLGPAVAMSLLRAYLRALALTYASPQQILSRVNHLVCEDTKHEWFATALFVDLDAQRGEYCYAGAGHEGYLMDAAGAVTRLTSTGMPLGISNCTTIAQSPAAPMQPGDILLLLSDGIAESHSREGDAFGLVRALDVVRAERSRPAQQIVEAVYQAVRAHRGDAAQEDDMTIVVVKTLALP
jgi:serine phosphatase RsbU (regulator of sigma subunit)